MAINTGLAQSMSMRDWPFTMQATHSSKLYNIAARRLPTFKLNDCVIVIS